MGTRAASIVAVVLVTGCGGNAEYRCDPTHSCGAGGTCEATTGFCSVPDSGCPSGRRYDGSLAGGLSGQCVDAGSGSNPQMDAGVDVAIDSRPPPDARVCFGTAPYTICLAAPPTGTIDISMPTTFDTVNGTVTGTPLSCATTTSDTVGYCVLAANTITISSPLRAIGTKPLILLAADSISVPMSIDVSSHRTPTESIGAGADPAAGCNAGTSPPGVAGAGGGGAGGSFLGAGGNGGNGGGAGGGNGGQHGNAPGIATIIHGGCPGQDGSGINKGVHGHGGGAVFLIAVNSITVGSTINAGGEGGAGGTMMNAGGGGGGAGGMIGFDAATVTVTGTLIANGGGGAEGAGNSTPGDAGGDANATTAAAGGGNNSNGGDGGNGSSGAANGSGMIGADGGGGGGGGGGGAGIIKAPVGASLGNMVSPAATQP